jgi:hypothetical protein
MARQPSTVSGSGSCPPSAVQEAQLIDRVVYVSSPLRDITVDEIAQVQNEAELLGGGSSSS